jgi:hypothetical protein
MLIVGPRRHRAPLALVSAARTFPISVARLVSKVAPRQVAFAKDVAGATFQYWSFHNTHSSCKRCPLGRQKVHQ